MNRTLKSLARYSAFCLLAAFAVQPAHGCSCWRTDRGFLAWEGPEEANVAVLPANALGLVFHTWHRNPGKAQPPDSSLFSLAEVAPNGSTREVAVVISRLESSPSELFREKELPTALWVVAPASGLLPGAEYRFSYHQGREREDLSFPDQVVRVEVPAAAFDAKRIQTRLERVDKGIAALSTLSLGGMCAATVSARQIGVRLELPSWAESLESSMLLVTTVDGEIWRPSTHLCSPSVPGRNWRGSAEALLYAVCDDPDSFAALSVAESLAEGAHEVTITGWVPGTGIVFDAHGRVTLTCD